MVVWLEEKPPSFKITTKPLKVKLQEAMGEACNIWNVIQYSCVGSEVNIQVKTVSFFSDLTSRG